MMSRNDGPRKTSKNPFRSPNQGDNAVSGNHQEQPAGYRHIPSLREIRTPRQRDRLINMTDGHRSRRQYHRCHRPPKHRQQGQERRQDHPAQQGPETGTPIPEGLCRCKAIGKRLPLRFGCQRHYKRAWRAVVGELGGALVQAFVWESRV